MGNRGGGVKPNKTALGKEEMIMPHGAQRPDKMKAEKWPFGH